MRASRGSKIRLPAGVTITGWDGVLKTRIAVERVDPQAAGAAAADAHGRRLSALLRHADGRHPDARRSR